MEGTSTMAVSKVYQLPLFPTEKRCTTCGETKPLDAFYRDGKAKDGRCSTCIPCRKDAAKAHYAANPEPAKARRRAYYQANTEYVKARERAYGRRNREALRQRAVVWRARNREAMRAAKREYWRAHLDECRQWARRYVSRHAEQRAAYARAWRTQHPEYARLKAHARRARHHQAEGSFTQADIDAIYAAQGGLCAYCATPLSGRYHIEHKQPLIRGGTNWPSNLCCSCQRCNNRKHTLTDTEFRDRLARHGM
jgi:5-methylcytosine-specific restriction endonuclease McrA